jgi:glutathione S-transferase
MITVYVFGNVTPEVHGITRDLRALWALEETGLLYCVHPLDDLRGELRRADYLHVNPFGLIPAIDDDGFRLFESGAILFYLADKAGKLLPQGTEARTVATQWAFAALSTVEPAITDLAAIDLFFADQGWAKERRPALVETVEQRLAILNEHLAAQLYIMGTEFSIVDILMSTVLRQIQHTDLIDSTPTFSPTKRARGAASLEKDLCRLSAAPRRLTAAGIFRNSSCRFRRSETTKSCRQLLTVE